jgi:hypothetical protein
MEQRRDLRLPHVRGLQGDQLPLGVDHVQPIALATERLYRTIRGEAVSTRRPLARLDVLPIDLAWQPLRRIIECPRPYPTFRAANFRAHAFDASLRHVPPAALSGRGLTRLRDALLGAFDILMQPPRGVGIDPDARPRRPRVIDAQFRQLNLVV